MKKIKLFVFIILIIFSIILLFACNKGEYTVIKHVDVIPMNQEIILKDYSVLIADNKIIKILPSHDMKIPFGSQVINGKGKYLIPGLSDMHVHFNHFNQQESGLYVANGVTLIRNMWGFETTLEFRKLIDKGRYISPEIYTTTPILDGKDPIWPLSIELTDPKKVETLLTQYKKNGYDAVKVYEKLSDEVYDEIIRVAKNLDMPVVGHVPREVGLDKVLDSEQYTIEHLCGYLLYSKDKAKLDDFIQKTIEKKIWNCPTLIVNSNLYLNLYDLLENPPKEIIYEDRSDVLYWKSFKLKKISKVSQEYIENAKNIVLYIITHLDPDKIVSGTDASNPFVISGFSLHQELELLHEAGLTNFEVLKTATINSAIMLGFQNRLGTIEDGKEADFVMLDKNPLEDISYTKSIFGVMLNGKWFSRKDLDQLLKDSIRFDYDKWD